MKTTAATNGSTSDCYGLMATTRYEPNILPNVKYVSGST